MSGGVAPDAASGSAMGPATSAEAFQSPPSGSAAAADDLLAGFVAAVARLEDSHERLRARADAIDLELAATNERLQRTLDEREQLFAALPVGVVAVAVAAAGEAGSHDAIWSNREAQRLRPVLQDAGVDWHDVPPGDGEYGGKTLRVRRRPLPGGAELVVLEDQSKVVGLEREVERLDRLAGLSELALGVAHEIKNPLNGVLGYASLIERTDDPARIRDFAGRIATGLRAVDAIVRDMLAFARPSETSGAVGAGGDRVDSAPVASVLQTAALEAGLPGDALDARGDLALRCDRAILGRVLVNLLRNAIEAAAPRMPRIDVVVEAVEDTLRIEVADDGPGVSADVEERLFEPFVSSHPGSRGLGLALSARVLSFIGGSIELLAGGATPGARFLIRMPRDPGADAVRAEEGGA